MRASAWDLLQTNNQSIDSIDCFKDILGHHETIREALECRDLCAKLKSEAVYELFVLEQREEINEIRRDEQLEIPTDLDYFNVQNLSGLRNEDREKLDIARPSTIAAASRIPGVTPNAVLSLLRFVRKKSNNIEFVS